MAAGFDFAQQAVTIGKSIEISRGAITMSKINLPLTDRSGNKIGTAEVDLENNTVIGQINIDGVMGF
jgi:hypothetical protein